jgi:hypothetical protein
MDEGFIDSVLKLAQQLESDTAKKAISYTYLDEYLLPKDLRAFEGRLKNIHPGLTLANFEEHLFASHQQLPINKVLVPLASVIEFFDKLAQSISRGEINPYDKLSLSNLLHKDILKNETNINRIKRTGRHDEVLEKDFLEFSNVDREKIMAVTADTPSGLPVINKVDLFSVILAGMTLTSAVRSLPPEQLGARASIKSESQKFDIDGLKDAHRAIGRLLGLIGADLSHAGETAQLIDRISDTLEARANASAKPAVPKNP